MSRPLLRGRLRTLAGAASAFLFLLSLALLQIGAPCAYYGWSDAILLLSCAFLGVATVPGWAAAGEWWLWH